jgi:aspartyl protease family protein
MSPGARQAAAMAGGWALASASVVVSVVYFAEIQDIAVRLLGSRAPQVAGQLDRGSGRGADTAVRTSARVVEVRAGSMGHYHAEAEINGRRVNVLVDTGATMVALTYEDAGTLGLPVRDSDFTHRVSTANGFGRIAPVMIDRISIGDITVRNVRGAVMEPGKLGTTLLGMSFLGRPQRVDMRAGTLVLQE